MVSSMKTLDLKPWQLSFYGGERLKAEVQLLGAAFVGDVSKSQLIDGSRLIKTSFGISQQSVALSPFQLFQGAYPEPQNSYDRCEQYLSAANCPDALLYWVMSRYFPITGEIGENRRLPALGRTARLLMLRFPKRLDLPYQVLTRDPTGSFLKDSPRASLQPWQ